MRRGLVLHDDAGDGPGAMILRELAAGEVARERAQFPRCLRLEYVDTHSLILLLEVGHGAPPGIAGGSAIVSRPLAPRSVSSTFRMPVIHASYTSDASAPRQFPRPWAGVGRRDLDRRLHACPRCRRGMVLGSPEG